MSRRRVHCATAIVLLLSCAELSAQTAPKAAPPAKTPDEPGAALPDLGAVPVPVVDVFEPAVARQLAEARTITERLIAERRADDSKAAFGTLCLLYLRYELFDAADPCLRQARTLEPDQFRWPYYQTFVYSRAADLVRAGESIAAALALQPRDVPSLLRAGDLHLLAHDAAKAETAFAAALAADPSSDAARFGLGRVAALRGDHAAAAAQFEKAVAGQPEGSIVHYHLGMEYRALGQLDRAREELAKSRQVKIVFDDPLIRGLDALSESRESTFARGIELMHQHQIEPAIAAFERVLELDPKDAQAHYNLARALIEIGDLARAETHLRAAIGAWPEFFDAHLNLAILLGRSGRDQEAAEHIEHAIRIDPEHLPTRMLHARVLAGRGETRAAIAELEAIVDLDPASTEARFALAQLQLEAGEVAAARDELEPLVELAPDDPRPRVGLATALMMAGDYARARAVLEQGYQRFPDHLALHDLLARLLSTCPDATLRDGPRAVAIAQQLVERRLTIEHAETLAMALAEAGRFDDAVVWQQRAIEQQSASGAATATSRQRLALYQAHRPAREPLNPPVAAPRASELPPR